MTASSAAESRFVTAQDGIRLHYRAYGSPHSPRLPVVCLPGLARTEADFAALATALSEQGRRVIAIDYRGRGQSDRDVDPNNYTLAVEAADVVTVLCAAEIDQAVFVGTSRGGLITMILAAHKPDLLRGVVLNDIGPVLERRGLERILGYVGKLPRPASWDDAVSGLRHVAGEQFTAMSDAEWLAYAQTTFEEVGGGFQLRYDPALSAALGSLDLANLPTMWEQFDALKAVSLLVIRGANSDLLSVATAEAMSLRHPRARLVSVPHQGHAPMLRDVATITEISRFVEMCDGAM